MSKDHQGYRSRDARRYWSTRLPAPCLRCGKAVHPTDSWDVDHIVPLSTPGAPANDPNNQWPSHSRCNRGHGQAIAQKKIRAKKSADQNLAGL
jgi:5-methylcytosine-specific restriction endonuclease McrA